MKNILFNRRRILVFLVILLTGTAHGVFAQVRVTKITSPEMLNGKSGIVYTLPGTQIFVDLKIVRTQEFTGPLAEYAGEFLGIDEVITKNAVNYTVESAAISAVTEPDPAQIYLIEKEMCHQWILLSIDTQ